MRAEAVPGQRPGWTLLTGLQPRSVELVGESTIPGAELTQKPHVPSPPACTPTLFEEGQVEEQDAQRCGQERRKPVRHDAARGYAFLHWGGVDWSSTRAQKLASPTFQVPFSRTAVPALFLSPGTAVPLTLTV